MRGRGVDVSKTLFYALRHNRFAILQALHKQVLIVLCTMRPSDPRISSHALHGPLPWTEIAQLVEQRTENPRVFGADF